MDRALHHITLHLWTCFHFPFHSAPLFLKSGIVNSLGKHFKIPRESCLGTHLPYCRPEDISLPIGKIMFLVFGVSDSSRFTNGPDNPHYKFRNSPSHPTLILEIALAIPP